MAKQKGRYTRSGVRFASEAIHLVCRTSKTATQRSRPDFLRRHQGWASIAFMALLCAVFCPEATAVGATYATVAAGGGHALALADDGTVWAWGFNEHGQLGDGTLQYATSPVQVQGLPKVKAISAGYTSSMALGRDGSVWTWGSNQSSQLGDGTTTSRVRPGEIQALDHVTTIAMNAGIGMAVKDDGNLWLWGQNADSVLAPTQNNVLAPVRMPGVSGVAGIGLGPSSLYIFTYDCALWAWGKNSFGQLGNGTTTSQSRPVRTKLVACLSGLAASNHVVALSSTGEVWTWGYNRDGQLGNDTTLNTSTPAIVSVPNNVVAVACDQHTLALQADGSVWAWGLNDYGQLGNGTTENRSQPRPVEGLRTVTSIAAGGMFSLAVKADGSVWAWGRNNYGQLGDGSTDNHSAPVQVTGFEGFGFFNLKEQAMGQRSSTPGSIPPVSFRAMPTSGRTPLTVAFEPNTGGGSPPVSLRWNFGDGKVANIPAPQHTYKKPGSYIVTLSVTFKQGVFRESMKQIVVKAAW